jgi:hypothetical protein
MNAYRHGEMILVPITETTESIWLDLFESSGNRMENPRIIAEGEVTGHKHEFEGGDVDGIELNDDVTIQSTRNSNFVSRRSLLRTLGVGAIAGPVMLMNIAKGATLKHPEHNALKIPEGHYVVYAQREYDEGSARRVLD